MNAVNKKECLTVFREIIGLEEDFTDKHLRQRVSSSVLFYFVFNGGHATIYTPNRNKTLLRNFYDLYESAEEHVTPETRETLKRVYISHKNYMKACILIACIRNGLLSTEPFAEEVVDGIRHLIFVRHLNRDSVNRNIHWLERMFTDQIPAERIFLAATRDFTLTTEEEYLSFINTINNYPVEWVQELYPKQPETGAPKVSHGQKV